MCLLYFQHSQHSPLTEKLNLFILKVNDTDLPSCLPSFTLILTHYWNLLSNIGMYLTHIFLLSLWFFSHYIHTCFREHTQHQSVDWLSRVTYYWLWYQDSHPLIKPRVSEKERWRRRCEERDGLHLHLAEHQVRSPPLVQHTLLKTSWYFWTSFKDKNENF